MFSILNRKKHRCFDTVLIYSNFTLTIQVQWEQKYSISNECCKHQPTELMSSSFLIFSGSPFLTRSTKELSTEFPDVLLNVFFFFTFFSLFTSSQFWQNSPFLFTCCSQNELFFIKIDYWKNNPYICLAQKPSGFGTGILSIFNTFLLLTM